MGGLPFGNVLMRFIVPWEQDRGTTFIRIDLGTFIIIALMEIERKLDERRLLQNSYGDLRVNRVDVWKIALVK